MLGSQGLSYIKYASQQQSKQHVVEAFCDENQEHSMRIAGTLEAGLSNVLCQNSPAWQLSESSGLYYRIELTLHLAGLLCLLEAYLPLLSYLEADWGGLHSQLRRRSSGQTASSWQEQELWTPGLSEPAAPSHQEKADQICKVVCLLLPHVQELLQLPLARFGQPKPSCLQSKCDLDEMVGLSL